MLEKQMDLRLLKKIIHFPLRKQTSLVLATQKAGLTHRLTIACIPTG